MDTEGQFHEQTALNSFEIDLDEIFWSSDEDMFISSHNTEIITIASDSDNYEFHVTIIEEIEDNKNWGEDELEGEDDQEKDNQKSLLLQFRICKYCKNILTNFNLPQCNTCWLEKRSGMSKPSNKKQKRKKLLSKNTKTEQLPSTDLSSDLCQLCCSNKKDGGFVHNTSCHFLCCYQCCKTIFEQQGRCPYCCRIIEKIVRIRC